MCLVALVFVTIVRNPALPPILIEFCALVLDFSSDDKWSKRETGLEPSGNFL